MGGTFLVPGPAHLGKKIPATRQPKKGKKPSGTTPLFGFGCKPSGDLSTSPSQHDFRTKIANNFRKRFNETDFSCIFNLPGVHATYPVLSGSDSQTLPPICPQMSFFRPYVIGTPRRQYVEWYYCFSSVLLCTVMPSIQILAPACRISMKKM